MLIESLASGGEGPYDTIARPANCTAMSAFRAAQGQLAGAILVIYFFGRFLLQSAQGVGSGGSARRVRGGCTSHFSACRCPKEGIVQTRLRALLRVSCFSCRMLVAFTLTAVVHQSPRSDGPHTSPHLEFKSMSLEYFDLTDSGPTSTSSAAWCPS